MLCNWDSISWSDVTVAIYYRLLVSDTAVFVLKRDVKLQLTNC